MVTSIAAPRGTTRNAVREIEVSERARESARVLKVARVSMRKPIGAVLAAIRQRVGAGAVTGTGGGGAGAGAATGGAGGGDAHEANNTTRAIACRGREKKSERPACTPGSVETIKFRTVISLGARSPVPSCSLPAVS